VRSRLTCTGHGAVGGSVVCDVAIEPLIDPLDGRAGKLELRFAQLLDARPVVRQIDRARVLRYFPHRQFVVRHPVLTGVGSGAAACDFEHGERTDPIGASERGGGIVNDLPLG